MIRRLFGGVGLGLSGLRLVDGGLVLRIGLLAASGPVRDLHLPFAASGSVEVDEMLRSVSRGREAAAEGVSGVLGVAGRR